MAKAPKTISEKIGAVADNLHGEGFKKSVMSAREAYDKGDSNQFVKINRKELWNVEWPYNLTVGAAIAGRTV